MTRTHWRRWWIKGLVLSAAAAGVASVVHRTTSVLDTKSTSRQAGGSGEYRLGTLIEGLDIDFSAADMTMLLFVSSSCRYCIDDAAFYRALSHTAFATPGALRLVVVGTEPVETLSQFVRRIQLAPVRVLSVNRTSRPTRIVPTVVLTDNRGRIQGLWTGEQSRAAQNSIRVRFAVGGRGSTVLR